MSLPDPSIFQRSIQEQIRINQARTPTERFQALLDLLEVAREMAPKGPEARERRLRALAAREREREKFRAELRRLIASQPSDAPPGV
jgi:hypothetical protein